MRRPWLLVRDRRCGVPEDGPQSGGGLAPFVAGRTHQLVDDIAAVPGDVANHAEHVIAVKDTQLGAFPAGSLGEADHLIHEPPGVLGQCQGIGYGNHDREDQRFRI
ncbi:hypothetical protein [Saccharopolyspora sp. ASAGF58]|uniref:hypothetical protein n=1 Tax=Saccharopolyspora sp. ASAGF58 TaxID=2719023 RepID=UPI0014465967|nr:hypothetical protein [Saccharopolyspora sp. ASAGF58]